MERFKNPSATRAGCKNLLLGSVSLLACGIVLARTPAAHAQAFPGSSNVTYNSNGANFVVNSGIDLTGNPAVAVTVTTHTIANHGTLASSLTALMNASTIGTLSNSGSISGKVGVSNADSDSFIQTFTNSGKILGVGSSALAVANFGTIAALTNSGTISSTSGDGIANYNSIGVLQNALGGTISGAIIGVFSDKNIGTLINAGIITGEGDTGVESTGTIGLLINNTGGTISGKSTGIDNQGFVGTLSNSGLVSGGTQDGISNFARISTLENIGQGLINGTIGINNQGFIGTLSNGSTATISGNSTGIGNGGIIGTLTNAGTISGNAGINNALGASFATLTNESTGTILGDDYGISNAGIIGTLTNAGLIEGGSGIFNVDVKGTVLSTIATLTNESTGTISGGNYGIYNNGVINTLTNDGLITVVSNFSATGIDNADLIKTLTNNGTITDALYGITNVNNGTIIALSNTTNATIYGGSTGINNETATIGTLTNAGLITGDRGIDNEGTITTLTNAGLITANASTNAYGIENGGTISLLTNSGTISSSSTAIFNRLGTIATLTNSGTISGYYFGIGNSGSIGILANNNGGTITSAHASAIINNGIINTVSNATGVMITGGYFAGIDNDQRGIIGTLTNAGTILGSQAGINNASGGTITTLINQTSGQIISGGTGGKAIANGGTIGTLINFGTISGLSYGVNNFTAGSISSLTNSGTISGAVNAITNTGIIATLTNAASGTLFAAASDINNNSGGYIGTLTNKGSIGGARIAIANYSSIGTLSNSGLIIGGTTGIYNHGTIATLTNAGTISGGSYGIFNGLVQKIAEPSIDEISNTPTVFVPPPSFIGTLTNSGLISGDTAGIYNGTGGTIGTLTNTGLITASTAILNSGTIGLLSNAGTIAGGRAGIYNTTTSGATIIGDIGTLSNSGLIIARGTGVYNDGGLIGALTNGGTISGNGYGINNFAYTNASIVYGAGSIGTLTNTGLISGDVAINNDASTIGALTNGGTISGFRYGIFNAAYTSAGAVYSASIGTLTNTGLITTSAFRDKGGGGTGIGNSGTIGLLSNTGTIAGGFAGIYNTTSGATIIGSIGTLSNSGLIIGGFGGIKNRGGNITDLTNSTIGTIAGGDTGIYNSGTIGTLTNAGTILGLVPGIYNTGLIQTLTNGGYIAGGMKYAGIYNTDSGTITSLSNTAKGTIIGTISGISNGNDGFIGTLTNAGVIAASERAGIYNSSEIAVIENTGTIGGGYDSAGNFDLAYFGIDNDDGGNIGQLTNDNLIIGSGEAIGNFGTITSLTNTGTIFGSITGIYNQIGQIQTLSNSGLITGFGSGIENNGGTITTLTNNATGTISGQTAIYSSSGGLGTLTNSGLIAGNVDVRNQDLNIIGGAGSIFGTLSGGNIYLSAGDNLNFLSGNQILTDNVSGITSDGGHGDNIGTLTNSGTLQIGTPGEPAAISVAGDYAQTPDGTLNVIVTPAASSEMTITGTASLSGGVDYIFAPGTYTPKTYDYLTAGSITGTFTSENYGTAPVSDVSTTYEGDPTADLVIGSGFSLPMVVNPSDSSIFSDQTQALAEATQQSNASLLGMAATGGAAASPACEGQAALNPGATNGNSANIASAIAAELCNHGGWIQAEGALGHVDGATGAAAYNANTAGFLAGIDSIFGPANTRLGLAIGYAETNLTDKAGGKASAGTTRVALYGAQAAGPILFTGVAGYGYANDSTTRATGVGGLKEDNNVNIISLGLQASTAYATPNFEIIPALGIRYANVGPAHFSESASGLDSAFALSGRTKSFNSLQPYATAELTTNYATASGYSIAPEVTFGGQVEAADRSAATNLFAADGTAFVSTHTNPDSFAAILGAGIQASKTNVTFYINYNGLIAGNWNNQSGTAGLRINF